jgi:methionyl-tRNA synthetase
MIRKFRDGVVPDGGPPADLAGAFEGLAERFCSRLDQFDLTGALEEVWAVVRRLNQYVQDEEPWKLAKDPAAAERLDSVLYGLAEGLRVVSVLLHPYMPSSTSRLLAALGSDETSLESARFGAAPGGAKIGELGQLFPRVEPREDAAA